MIEHKFPVYELSLPYHRGKLKSRYDYNTKEIIQYNYIFVVHPMSNQIDHDRLFKELEEKLVNNLFKEQATTGKLSL